MEYFAGIDVLLKFSSICVVDEKGKIHRESRVVIVSTPSLAFSPRVVEAHEPVCVQTFGAELAVERFDEGVVGLPGREKSSVTPRW